MEIEGNEQRRKLCDADVDAEQTSDILVQYSRRRSDFEAKRGRHHMRVAPQTAQDTRTRFVWLSRSAANWDPPTGAWCCRVLDATPGLMNLLHPRLNLGEYTCSPGTVLAACIC